MSYEEEQRKLQKLYEEVGSESDFIDSESEGEIEEMDNFESNNQNERRSNDDVESDEEESEEEVPIEESSEQTWEENNSNIFWGKDRTRWNKMPKNKRVRTRADNIIIHLPCVRASARDKNTPVDCWSLFITDNMVNDIAKYTNIKIATLAAKYNAEHQYLVNPTTAQEIKALIGLLYLSGLYKANRQNVKDLWATDGCGIDIFRRTMSYQRFLILLKCLRFDNITNRAARRQLDKLAPIRSITDQFIDNCKVHYSPSEYLTIDEKLESFRGRCGFRQYMPNKPAKYGLKVFALVDAKTFYCLNFEVYVGIQPEGPYRLSNKPDDLVIRLIQPISGTRRNITFDNWFTSFPLMKNLLSNHQLTSVGTVRKNKKEIPVAFLDVRRREVPSTLFAFQEDITVVSVVPKKNKNVILFST